MIIRMVTMETFDHQMRVGGSSVMGVGRAIQIGMLLAACLGGCTTYELRVEAPIQKDLGVQLAPIPTVPTVYAHSKPYLYVFAAMSPTQGSSVTPCADNWVYAALRTRVLSMSVSMDVGANGNATNLKVPLYTVSSSSSGCMASYDHMYVFPRAPVASDARYEFPIDVLYQSTGTENMSGYTSVRFAEPELCRSR
jgi:hypothetical protein